MCIVKLHAPYAKILQSQYSQGHRYDVKANSKKDIRSEKSTNRVLLAILAVTNLLFNNLREVVYTTLHYSRAIVGVWALHIPDWKCTTQINNYWHLETKLHLKVWYAIT